MTEEDKKFIRTLVDKTIFFPENKKEDDDIDFTVEEVNVNPPSEKEDEDKLVYIKTAPVPSGDKPLHPRECLRQKVKKIRKRREKYGRLTKKRPSCS